MTETLFKGLFDNELTRVISLRDFLLCVGVSLVLGLFLSFCYTRSSHCSGNFTIALALLPAVVCVVIMMVNGNIGTGVAVAGAFGLVRFRSAPGTAKEITALFLGTGTGLITGMGYLGYGVLFALIMGGLTLLYTVSGLGSNRNGDRFRTIRITIPEDLDYTGVFDGPLKEYTSRHRLVNVKTTNMGSMFRLTYEVTLRDPAKEKELIDKLRLFNGNLEISVSGQEHSNNEL